MIESCFRNNTTTDPNQAAEWIMLHPGQMPQKGQYVNGSQRAPTPSAPPETVGGAHNDDLD